MSGFGQNPPGGSSAFSFPTLNQQNSTAPGAAPGFSFGAPKTTATTLGVAPSAPLGVASPTVSLGVAPSVSLGAAPTTSLGAAPAFGVSPSLGVKTSINLTAASTPSGIPTLGTQQPGTLFGTSWSGGMFSAGSNATASTTASTLPTMAPAAPLTAATTTQFSFGTPTSTPASQGQTLLGSTTGVSTTSTPGFSMPTSSLAPAPAMTQAATSAPTLNFSFGSSTPNTTVGAPSLGLSVPNFGVPAASKPQATAPPAPAAVASTPLASSTFTASTPLASSTFTASTPLASSTFTASAPLTSTTLFSVASTTTPAVASPLATVTKTTASIGMPMFSAPTTSAPPATSAPLASASVSLVVPSAPAPATSAPAQTTTSTVGSVVPATTAAATTPATAASEEDVMTYSKLQENINKWAMELEKQEKIFLHQATEMNGWDRVIVENSDKLHMLNAKIEKVRKEQRHLDLELDYILSQQNELDHMLKGLEKEWGSVPPSDPERQHTYKIAESLDYKLKLMSEDLKEVVDHMNAMNYPPNDEFNPVMQIVRILNAHMNVLLMVERKTNLADCKVKEVGKLLELCKRDYDRACHLYFD